MLSAANGIAGGARKTRQSPASMISFCLDLLRLNARFGVLSPGCSKRLSHWGKESSDRAKFCSGRHPLESSRETLSFPLRCPAAPAASSRFYSSTIIPKRIPFVTLSPIRHPRPTFPTLIWLGTAVVVIFRRKHFA